MADRERKPITASVPSHRDQAAKLVTDAQRLSKASRGEDLAIPHMLAAAQVHALLAIGDAVRAAAGPTIVNEIDSTVTAGELFASTTAAIAEHCTCETVQAPRATCPIHGEFENRPAGRYPMGSDGACMAARVHPHAAPRLGIDHGRTEYCTLRQGHGGPHSWEALDSLGRIDA